MIALGLGAGCGGQLPLQERIASTRPLALRVEVVEPTRPPDDPVRAEGLPLDTVRIVPFIVDPDGPLTTEAVATQIEPVWIACNMQPLQGLFGCISARFPIGLDEIEDCQPTDLSALDPSATELPQPPNPCLMVDGDPGEPELQIPLDLGFLLGGDLEITMIGHVPGEGDTNRCAQALLGEEDSLPESCILSVVRAPVGPDAKLTQLATMFGLDDAFDLGPIPDPIPDPDANPRIMSFSIAVLDDQDNVQLAQEVTRGDVVEIKAGQRIEIVTEASPDDQQTYVISKDSTGFEEKTELYSGSWFRTWGTLLSPSSNDPKSLNTWTMVKGEQDEDELPPDGRATLFYVLRDDRQGVDWFWFSVNVTE